jgi:peptidoglycan hydrolase-like protein with peptidoglycan-binding domain
VTDEAVRAFQESNELDVDGIVGANTWAALGY